MSATNPNRPLIDDEITQLQQQGCWAQDWSRIQVEDGFDPARVQNSQFAGDVQIGSLEGDVTVGGVTKPAGIYNAYVADCTIGSNSRIANIGAHLANYDIGDDVCIENVGTMQTQPGATFGNGVEIEVLNEGGGREIILFNELSSQFAHLLCLHRYRTKLIEKLQAMAQAEADRVKSDRGTVADHARIASVSQIVDVNVGPHAVINGASSLHNGTILSSADAPTTIGADVQAEDFIIAESTTVDGGSIVSKSFVGQGCQIGKQYSSEGSVFFANCEGFHGEACSIFAGPYTVTHHKSTLLIAGLFSFYNAGSGTNQSNHMYKLGPVHEGKLERGSKTGSFSYMMWPCRVGPFSVVLGKHTRNFDTADFPFSLIEASPSGRCMLIPGLTLSTVGTVRDGAKWPTRDRRKGELKRDRLSFDVLSPLTVGRMIKGSARLKQLQETTDKSVDTVTVNGAEIKRVILRSGQKFYRSGIQLYLLQKVVDRIEAASGTVADALASSPDAVYSEDWLDIGGQLMPRKRMDDLSDAVANGSIKDIAALNAALDKIHESYDEDEWVWVKRAYQDAFGTDLDQAGMDGVMQAVDALLAAQTKFLNLILADATKEFDDLSSMGFGQDGTADDVGPDFEAVRGRYDGNKFVKQMQEKIKQLESRVGKLKQSVAHV